MKTSLDENIINNNSKGNNIINFISKDLNKPPLSNILSDSNMELNLDEYKNKDFRCLTCYLIPFLTLDPPTNLIDINCNYGHTKKINLEEYLQSGYNNNFINLCCSKCKAQFIKNENIFMYCKECSEIVCDKCIIKHNNMFDDHHMINSDKYDTTCILHNETYDYFCLDCKKNICQYCSDDFHSEHHMVDLDDIIFKRKEIKNIKENLKKERENYLNVPYIFNDLVIKLKQDLDKIMINIKNQIIFKQSIINTYENKVDNYNAILNLKNLVFNLNPFVIDKNISTIDNIINLMKYANMSDILLNNKYDNLKKTFVKTKIKNKNDKDKIIKNSNSTVNIQNNNEFKRVKIEENENAEKKYFVGGRRSHREKKIEEINNMNTHKKFNTFGKRNVIFNPKRNENIIPIPNKIKEYNEIRRNNNKSVQIINKETYEDKNVIDKNSNKYKLPDFFERYKKIKRDNEEKNVNNKKEENIYKNNEERIFRKLMSRSTNSLNYVKTEPQEFRSSNNNLQLKKLIQNDNKEDKDSPQPIKISFVNDKDKETYTLTKKFKNNEIIINKEYEKRNLSNIKKENHKEIKLKNEIKNTKKKQSNKKLRRKDKLMVSGDEEDEEDEEEEEEEDDDEDENNNNEEFESDQDYEENEEEESEEVDNKNNIRKENKIKKEKTKLKTNIRNAKYDKYSNDKNYSKDKKYLNDKRMSDDKKYSNNKYYSKDKKYSNDKRLSDDRKLSNNKRLSNDKKFSNDKRLSKDKKLSNNKRLSNDKKYSNAKDFDKEVYNEIKNKNTNEFLDKEENEFFRHQKIYPKSNVPLENLDISEISANKKNIQLKNDLLSIKEKDNSNKINTFNKNRNNNVNNINKFTRDININEFRSKSANLKMKETNNTVCCLLEVKDNIFACGFLLGEIDVYNVNYLNCLFSILEHKSRISNMSLLKDQSILTTSFDHTMKKIRINGNNTYTLEYEFKPFKNIVYKGIELNNNDIVSISFRGNINIFKKEGYNNYKNYRQHEIADEEIYNVIELYPIKELAIATDECLRFFSMDIFKNIGNVHLLEFRKGNNMVQINKNYLIVLLKHDLGLVNIYQRQLLYKCSLGNIGKPECICYLKDNTVLVGMSNNKYDKIQFLFRQYGLKMNKLKIIAEKLEEIKKKEKDDYCRISSIIELQNKNIVYVTSGFEEFKLVGNIAIMD